MALVTLPPELKLNIADFLDPGLTLSFALTCRDHATLVKSALKEHGRLLAEWNVIDTTDARTLLWETMKDVIANPRLGWYVRELNLPESRQYNWNANESLSCAHPKNGAGPSDEDKNLFVEAARKLRHLYPPGLESRSMQSRYYHVIGTLPRPHDTIGSIEDRIYAGFEDAIVALLLHYLPYLKTIRHALVDMEDCLELVLWQIAKGYKDPAIAPKLPLQYLKTVALRYTSDEGSSSPDWACFYLSIPTLKTFAAQAMGGAPTEDVQRSLFPEGAVPYSNVKEMFFRYCQFDVDGLAAILAGIKHLEKFMYDGGGVMISESCPFYQSKRAIQAVATHAGHSLEELMLNEEDESFEPIERGPATVSLRKFQKLRMLYCPWRMLRPEREEREDPEHDEPLEQGYYWKEDYEGIDTDFDVRTILPESLEELYLDGEFEVYEEFEQMKNAFEGPSTFTPRLTMEKTCIQRGHWSDWIGTAEKPCGIWSHPLGRLFDSLYK